MSYLKYYNFWKSCLMEHFDPIDFELIYVTKYISSRPHPETKVENRM